NPALTAAAGSGFRVRRLAGRVARPPWLAWLLSAASRALSQGAWRCRSAQPVGIADGWCHMELERIFLARFAEITPDGLFTAVGGGMNRILVSGFPWSMGFLFLLTQYRLSAEEAGRQHGMAVERETPNGRTEPIGAEFPMIPLPPKSVS